MSEFTLADQVAGMRAVLALAAENPDLPGVRIASGLVRIGDHYQLGVEVAVHNDLHAFEQWREALGVDPDAVTHHTQTGTTRRLEANTVYAGVPVRLVGYAPLFVTPREAVAA